MCFPQNILFWRLKKSLRDLFLEFVPCHNYSEWRTWVSSQVRDVIKAERHPGEAVWCQKKRTGKKPLFSFWQVFLSFPLSLSLDPLCRPADGRHAGEDEGGQSADRGTGCTYSCSQQKRLTRGKKKDGKGARDCGTSIRWSVPCMAVEAPCLRSTLPVFCSYPLVALCHTQQTFR